MSTVKEGSEAHVRPSWDEYFIGTAQQTARRGTCNRLRVGCVLVKDKKIIGTGYNGSPRGQPHCDDIGHLLSDEGRCVRTVHAETNAVLFSDPDKLQGATAYVTHQPCNNCTNLLIQAGIRRIVYISEYPNKYTAELLKGSGIAFEHWQQ